MAKGPLVFRKFKEGFLMYGTEGIIPAVDDQRKGTWVLSSKGPRWPDAIGHEAPKETDTEKKVVNSLYKEHCILVPYQLDTAQ